MVHGQGYGIWGVCLYTLYPEPSTLNPDYTMLIIPAIDLRGGKVVRLYQGKYDEQTVYAEDPLAVARSYEEAGAKLIHVVDLDGAKTGEPVNLALAEKIFLGIVVPVEFGGGVRSLEKAEQILRRGAARVVVGTRAVQDDLFLRELIRRFGNRVAVGLDVASGMLCLEGWTETSETCLAGFMQRLEEAGVKTIIYTSIKRDGTLSGPDFAGIREVLALVKKRIEVVASGGVSSLKDLEELKKLEPEGVSGVIVGRALYEKKFTLKEAIDRCQN